MAIKNQNNFTKDYIVRKAQVADTENIAYVHWKTWQTDYPGILIKQEAIDERTLSKCIQRRKEIFEIDNTISFVALFKNQIGGFIDGGELKFHGNQQLSENQKKERTEKGEVYSLYILKEYQGQGVGSLLFTAIREEFKQRLQIPFLLWTLKDNLKARSFYEKQGGILVDEVAVSISNTLYQEVAYKFEI